jgi:hypothetical protein
MGVSSFGFHLSNLLFNSLSVVLFYFMALMVLGGFRVSGRGACAFLSSVLFALHPMHVESVSWVAGRSDVLCALFLFLAFIFHMLTSKNLWLLGIAALGFSLSLMSKEVAVVFPLLVVVFDLLSRRFPDRRNIIRYGVYLSILLLYFYLRSRAFVNIPQVTEEAAGNGIGSVPGGSVSISAVSRYLDLLEVLLGSYLFYLNKLMLPFDFNAFIMKVPMEAVHLISSRIIIAALAVLVFISVRKKENVTAFGILWILITLGPSALIAVFTIASTPPRRALPLYPVSRVLPGRREYNNRSREKGAPEKSRLGVRYRTRCDVCVRFIREKGGLERRPLALEERVSQLTLPPAASF